MANSLRGELERIINFYLTHWSGESIKDVVVLTPAFGEEIAKLMKDEFTDLNVQIVDPGEINAVVGAAWRGAVPRSSDTEISLASLSALGVFERQQFINFIRIWRNIFATSLGFLLLLFVSTNIFLRSEMSKKLEDSGSVLSGTNAEEFTSLSKSADEFNKLVEMITSIKGGDIKIAPFLVRISDIAGENIKITRLDIGFSDSLVLLNGIAPDENAAVEFKNRVAADVQFSEVYLPLSNISAEGEDRSFTLTFKLLNLIEDVPHEAEQPEAELPPDEVDEVNEEMAQPKNSADLGGELQIISEELVSTGPEGTDPPIVFGNISFVSSDEFVYLDVSALDSGVALLFRDLLEESSAFYGVEITTEIVDSADGRVDFTIKFLIGP